MGVYCCCGQRVSEKCLCDWTGWNEIASREDHPKKNGFYLTRYTDNGGDRHEREQLFSVEPIKIESTWGGSPYPVHWQFEHWDDNLVTHWKELPKPPEIT